MSWSFFVSHYSNTTQAYRDSKYTWRYPNGTLHVGACDTLPDDSNAEPLGILYPRAGTLGGCAQHDAMNFALPPDRDWDFIANLTDDESWSAENMRSIFASIESNQYVLSDSVAAEGHGFHGWLAVGHVVKEIPSSCSFTDSCRSRIKTTLSSFDHRMVYERSSATPIHFKATIRPPPPRRHSR